MATCVVFIHTVPLLIDLFARLSREMMPGVSVYHILDEPLLEQVRRRGHLDPRVDAVRLRDHVAMAEALGAKAVLVTCSTLSPCVDDFRTQVGLPVVKIDEAMIARAVQTGRRVGVVATNPTTLGPSCQALHDEAARHEKPIEIRTLLVEEALAALESGDAERHDELVRTAILRLASEVDVVVLAQASSARAQKLRNPIPVDVPILASPHLALEQVRGILLQSAPEIGG